MTLLTLAKDMEVHCKIDEQLNILIFALMTPRKFIQIQEVEYMFFFKIFHTILRIGS
jgi:hypothetical protein